MKDEHAENIWVVSVSELVAPKTSGLEPASVRSPLLNRLAPVNADDKSCTALISPPNMTRWLNEVHALNM